LQLTLIHSMEPSVSRALARARRSSGQGGRAWSRHYEGITPGGNMNMASDGTTTCVSVSGYSRCTGE
jgi:hypothetical protein